MDEQAKDDFVAEIKFMRTLRHKNIVYFYGCGVQNDQVRDVGGRHHLPLFSRMQL